MIEPIGIGAGAVAKAPPEETDTVVVLGSAAGSWLFFVQHQYEGAYWQPRASWDFTLSALEGSSYYRLPSILRWFSGNLAIDDGGNAISPVKAGL